MLTWPMIFHIIHLRILQGTRTEPNPQRGARANDSGLKNLMAGIVARKVRETGDGAGAIDSTRTEATKAIDHYLALPLSDPDETGEDTFRFWRDYSITTDKAQKALCHLARLYLTPAPTSTDVERLFSTAGGESY